MNLRSTAKSKLPARAQDALRITYDTLSPSRSPLRSSGRDELAAQVSPGGSVLAGPFAGMRLTLDASWGGNAARVAGTYEMEIAASLVVLLDGRPPLVVDIGAAEGYYAVGVARYLPHTPVVAFELEQAARKLCKQNAIANGVSNLRVRGRVTPQSLGRVLVPHALVICDVEGYEDVLIDPHAVPGLGSCDLLVELHEFAVAGVTGRIVERFSGSHDVHLVDAVPRSQADADALSHMPPAEALRAIQEGRPTEPSMQWAIITRR